MSDFFDPITLIFLVAAVVIFLKLRSVLGRRTGHERPPFDPMGRSRTERSSSGDDKVVPIPRRDGAVAGPTPMLEGDTDPWAGIAKPGSPLAGQLDTIREADRSFDARQFIHGARIAYEMIVTAFAEGDRKTLRPLLSPDVYDGFVAAIEERESRGEIIESRFIGIETADIVSAEIKNDQAQVTVRFRSSLVTVTRDKSGAVVDGDPKAVSDVTDVWTFARPLGARDPNWQLVATESD